MVWLSSVFLSALVVVLAYLAPEASTPATSKAPAGFLLLWTRYSAHIAFAFLLVAFSASSLKALFHNRFSHALVGYRRQLGLGFATAHGFHLIALTLFLSSVDGFQADASLAVAGFGYVITALLAITSNNWSVRRLGITTWRRIHTVGISILMLYFFVAFSERVLSREDFIYGVYVALIAAAVVTKIWVKRQRPAMPTG